MLLLIEQLKVNIEPEYKIISVEIEGDGEISEGYPQTLQYQCIATVRTPQGNKRFYSQRNPEYFTWSSDDYTLVNSNGTFNVFSAQNGFIHCTFDYNSLISGDASKWITHVSNATYEYVGASVQFVRALEGGNKEWKVVVQVRENGSTIRNIDVRDTAYIGGNTIKADWEELLVNNTWRYGTFIVSANAQFRVSISYNGVKKWTSPTHNN